MGTFGELTFKLIVRVSLVGLYLAETKEKLMKRSKALIPLTKGIT